MVKVIYVEKKKPFANKAKELLKEFREVLMLGRVEGVRVINRYFVEDLSDEAFEEAKQCIFSEPPMDDVYGDIDFRKLHTVVVEYLPGQFDQRARSAEECLQFIAHDEHPTVKTAAVYVISGPIENEDLEKIKDFLINPIECREASLSVPVTLKEDYPEPGKDPVIEGFCDFSDEKLADFIKENGMAMDVEDLKLCREYFKGEKRDPGGTELRVIDTYWSDHCRHTTFNTTINGVTFKDDKINETFGRYLKQREELGIRKPVSLMNIATIAMKALRESGDLKHLVESEEINACTVDFTARVDGKDEDWVLLFKNETHNHPTEIEPFGGAATCVGGAIRDPLSGRGYVYAAMRVTGVGDPLTPISKTRKGKLPQRKISTSAASGYSSYGNQIGLTTGLVDEIYHDGYVAKRMEVGAVIAAAPAHNIRRERPEAGDKIILLGGKTGRDGIGGATGSSKSHSEGSLKSCGTEVQKGNAPEERKIQRLFRNPQASMLIKRCNDFGAGGVAVAIGELADGLEIDLDKVPKKYGGLSGMELAISESQERMAVVLDAEDVDRFTELAESENLRATVVAEVTDRRYLTMMYKGEKIVDISRDFLDTNGAEKQMNAVVESSRKFTKKIPLSVKDGMLALVDDLNVCSKRGLSERFDSTIGARTVLMPFGGATQRTPIQAMVHKIPIMKGDCETVSLMSYGFNPYISEKSPYHGAYLAVVESISKLIATGATYKDIYLSFQEYFEKLGENEQAWGRALSAVLGAYRAQMDLGIAAIGGKDSMSGTFEDIHVPPTLISFAVTTDDIDRIVSPEFKKRGHKVILVKPRKGKDGLPDSDSLKKCFKTVEYLIGAGVVAACSTVGYGGIAEAVYKMSIGNRVGFEFSKDISLDEIFGYSYGSFILEVTKDVELSDVMTLLGKTVNRDHIGKIGDHVSLDALDKIYEGKLEPIYPNNVEGVGGPAPEMSFMSRELKMAEKPCKSKPRFLIPVFPGTNCEYDAAIAIEEAGGTPDIFIVNNLDSDRLKRSLESFADRVSKSQAVFIPGGFSGADEPDGSGKFITSFFRNDAVEEEIMKLLKERDGLMAGICNGFQALIKMGLLPYGEIEMQTAASPTLAHNDIDRHQSKIVRTRICSTKSPWMRKMAVGKIVNVPISHGEGKFVAGEDDIDIMMENGQILTQYVDPEGNPTMDVRDNPNGSTMAIEGILSTDGRILGKMGHSERIGHGLYKNVVGDYEIKMFESAVDYFKGE